MTILEKLSSHRYCLSALVVSVGAGYALGRYIVPERVIETTKVEWKDRITVKEVVREVKVSGPVRIQEKIVERPGVDRITERVIDRGGTTTTIGSSSSTEASRSGATESIKVVERDIHKWSMDLGAQWSIKPASIMPSSVDAGLGRRILGPVWLSVSASAPMDRVGDLRAYRFGIRARVEF